jgi:hypothetical protein
VSKLVVQIQNVMKNILATIAEQMEYVQMIVTAARLAIAMEEKFIL